MLTYVDHFQTLISISECC